MSKPFIFISCGQFTVAEKRLGKAIRKMVADETNYGAFFAEEVQDLNGLDENILNALRDCIAFITVLHPRGEIVRPDGSKHIRASVWIEQEIAIATYIKRVQKKPLPVIAFIHSLVGLEGLRSLLHLNPIPFETDEEVLNILSERLRDLSAVAMAAIVPRIRSTGFVRTEDDHAIKQLIFSIYNDSDYRIEKMNGYIRIPAGILKHDLQIPNMDEEKQTDRRYRVFRFDERHVMPVSPKSLRNITWFDYCRQCAVDETRQGFIGSTLVDEYQIEMTLWIDGQKYHILKTLKELAQETNVADPGS